MAYTPGSRFNLILNIDEAYTPPSRYNTILNFAEQAAGEDRELNSLGTDSLVFGLPGIKNRNEKITPAGWQSFRVGQATIWKYHGFARPTGLNHSLFGNVKVENKLRYLKTLGRSSLAFGVARIESLRSYIRPSGLNSLKVGTSRISFNLQSAQIRQNNVSTLWGNNTFIAFALRYVEANSTMDMARYGKAWIEYNPRYIEPRGLFEQFPSNHQIGISRAVGMIGHDSSRFGTRIIPENQTIYPLGFSTIFGETKIHNYVQHVYLRGFLTAGETQDHRWGRQEVFNSTQYVAPFHYENDKTTGKWEYNDYATKDPLQVFNRNRPVKTYGTLMQKFGYAEITNKARVVHPVGLASLIEVNPTKTMITQAIRPFKIPSIEPPHFSSNHIIWLSGKRYNIPGARFDLFGTAHLENTRRIYRFISLGAQSLFGQAMISHAIRQVRIQSDYSIAAPVIPMPEVKLGVRYLETCSIDSVRYGNAFVEERFTKIFPRWILVDRVGEPQIRNKTPQLRARGISMDEYGLPYIGLYTRGLNVEGLNSQIFGRTTIADTKQTVDFLGYGIGKPEFTKTHKIEIIGAGNYIPRRIHVRGIETENFPREGSEERHKVTQNVLRPDSEKPMTLYGNAVVTANTIRVEPGYYERLYGTPRVEHKNRKVLVAEWTENLIPPKPRISPHTIWVTDQPPEQARQNHIIPDLPLHHIDGYKVHGKDKPGIAFGKPSIAHRNQRVQFVSNNNQLKMGEPKVWLQSMFIQPKGFNNLRIGQLGPIGSQHITFMYPPNFALFGGGAIAHVKVFNNKLSPASLPPFMIGKPTIDHFHRTIRMTGLFSQDMGTKLNNDKPYMWQGLRVGSHVPFVVGGGLYSQYGQAWISERVREIRLEGFDSALVAAYDPKNFAARLQVWVRHHEPAIPKQTVMLKGLDSLVVGVPDIKPTVHYIRPDGNSDNFRKGGLF